MPMEGSGRHTGRATTPVDLIVRALWVVSYALLIRLFRLLKGAEDFGSRVVRSRKQLTRADK